MIDRQLKIRVDSQEVRQILYCICNNYIYTHIYWKKKIRKCKPKFYNSKKTNFLRDFLKKVIYRIEAKTQTSKIC